MEFTYNAYKGLIELLQKNNYTLCNYHNHKGFSKLAILRHDVDYCLNKALELAKMENSWDVSSTYFILLSSDFYNVFSKSDKAIITEIKNLGHEIGLHFDETVYNSLSYDEFINAVEKERTILSRLLDIEINSVSMHRPSKETLKANYNFINAENSYSRLFFEEFKYLSDSRAHWREPVLDIIKSNKYEKLQILVHSFWYSNKGISAKKLIEEYINSANLERYNNLKGNISNIDEFMKEADVK